MFQKNYQTLPVQDLQITVAPGQTNARYKPFAEILRLRQGGAQHGAIDS